MSSNKSFHEEETIIGMVVLAFLEVGAVPTVEWQDKFLIVPSSNDDFWAQLRPGAGVEVLVNYSDNLEEIFGPIHDFIEVLLEKQN